MAAPAAAPKPQINLISAAMPPEIILKIVQFLPFDDGKGIIKLQHVHRRLRDLLRNYERSLTRMFMSRELPHASTDFPCYAKFGYRCLANCVKRYNVVDDLMDALVSRQNCYAAEEHNMALLNTGLLLIYRISSLGMFRCLTRAKHYLANTSQRTMAPDSRSSHPFLATLS